MQTLDRLGAEDLVSVVVAYRDALRAHRERMNQLNVYPVPDGDTGTNMSLTLDSVVAQIESDAPAAEDGTRDLVAVTKAISHGSLMGARGNSGVILSQILRGMAGVFAPLPAIDGPRFVEALARARQDAYGAVGNPIEGTILTVIRAASEAAASEAAAPAPAAETAAASEAAARTAAAETALVEVAEAARQGAADALEATPEMLPALKAAGVVDSGGYGLVLFFDAFLFVVAGRPVPPAPEGQVGPPTATKSATRPHATADGEHPTVDELRYEVMFMLEAPDESVPGFRDVWAGVGDSIVVVGGDGLYNCHIHTDDIGAAIEAGLDAGRPRQIRVSDLWDQVEEERWVREATAKEKEQEGDDEPLEEVACAVVAVCNGDGIRRIFHSLGVQVTVAGGQSMNPSTADILAAIERSPAPEVVVLPNNKNIVSVARSAADAAAAELGKTVQVVPTVGIPEGFAALLDYDPEGNAADNAGAMETSAARVVSGEVTVAVRDSDTPAGPIRKGDWIGLTRAGIEVAAPDPAEAAIRLLAKLVDGDHHEIATIISGEGAQAADTRRITEWLAERWPAVGVEVHHGGQPLYPYLLSIE